MIPLLRGEIESELDQKVHHILSKAKPVNSPEE